MKTRFAFLLVLLPLLGYGQEKSILPALLATSASSPAIAPEGQIKDFISTLKNNGPASDIALLRKVFHNTHKDFLHQYVPYSGFSELFESGKYDCLTATALFSIVLKELNFDYRIIETNYHIFLLVKTSHGEVMLETTDRFNGFVKNENEIRRRTGSYRQSGALNAENKTTFYYRCDLYREVDQNRLPGLLYYNQAVKAFNAGQLEACGEFLALSKSIYDTPRVSEFGSLFLKSVLESDLDDPTKLRIIRRFKGIAQPKVPVLALR